MIFCLMAVGYVLGMLGWMDAGAKKFVSRFVVNIAVPMNCITGILNNFNRSDLAGMGRYLLIPVCTIIINLAISLLAAKFLQLPRKRFGVFVAMAFLSNTLFIGLPLSTQLFGEQAVGYVMLYYIGCTVFTQTVCVMLVERSGTAAPKEHSAGALLKEIFTKPPILGLIAAMTMLLLNVRPPEMFMSFAKYLSSTVSPLALLYCGYIVYELGIRNPVMWNADLSSFFGWNSFGVAGPGRNDVPWQIDEDGKTVVCSMTLPGYKECLQWMHDAFAEGLGAHVREIDFRFRHGALLNIVAL